MKTGNHLVSETGEFNLIDRIKKIVPVSDNPDIMIGMGDDTAVIRVGRNKVLLLTCDIQVEDRHFRRKFITDYQLGRRSMAVTISDIAAMGGLPSWALVSLGLPETMTVDEYDELFRGIEEELQSHSAVLVGGNLARTEGKLIVDITVLGESKPSEYVTRSGASEGDGIFVTGVVGASGAGFEVLNQFGKNFPQKYENLVHAHLMPRPRVQTGNLISGKKLATAMIDISDGIASDLYHICQSSGVGARIFRKQLPLPANIDTISEFSEKDIIDLALHSGEDYELLFTAPEKNFGRIRSEINGYCGVPVTKIGEIISKKSGYLQIHHDGREENLHPSGWDHFAGK